MVREGEFPPEVALYLQKWKEKIIKEKSPKTLYEKALEDERWYEIREIKGTGILFSYFVRNDMKFVLNDQGYFVRDNFYVNIKPPPADIPLPFPDKKENPFSPLWWNILPPP